MKMKLLGMDLTVKDRIRSSVTPRFAAAAQELNDLTGFAKSVGTGIEANDMISLRLSDALLGGLSAEMIEALIAFAVEVITSIEIEGVDGDYATLTKEERADFIDLSLTVLQLVCLFFALWPHYAAK